MSQTLALFPVPRGGFNKRLKQAAQLYPGGYAERFIWGGKSWLLCASANVLVYPKFFAQGKTSPQGIAVCQLQGRKFIYAWDKVGVLVCFLGDKEKVSALVTLLLQRKHFRPQLWLDDASQAALLDVTAEIPSEDKHPWPTLSDREQQKLKMYSVKRLSSKPWLGLVSIISLLVFIGYGLNTWAPWHSEPEWQDPGVAFEARLATTGANIIPLLRLDYNQQLMLQQLLGWQLERVEYSPQSVRYRLRRETGSIQSLRDYARKHALAVQLNEGYAQLTRAIQLPSAISAPSDVQWHTVTELTDWLDFQLTLWLPSSRLKLGKLQRVANWQQQQITIELHDYHLPDLLTLAGILDGLPLQLTQGAFQVQSHLISGQITMQAIGALG